MALALVTGFEPFGGLHHNPSAAVLSLLPTRIGEVDIRTAVLPVDQQRAPAALAGLWRDAEDLVVYIGLGLAQGRPTPTLERQGENRLHFDQPDNGGAVPRDQQVVAGAPRVLPVRLPVAAILQTWADAGIAGAASDSAGTFLCNQTLFLALHQLPDDVQVGFVHLAADETLGGSWVPLATQAEAVRLALQVTLGTG